jgi:hypothetical protein
MSAKIIPFHRCVIRVSQKKTTTEFVQVPLAGLFELFEEMAFSTVDISETDLENEGDQTCDIF